VKKTITVAKNRNENFKQPQLTIGVDLGDRISHYCILDETGNVILEQSVPTTPKESSKSLARSRAVESHWKPGHIRPG